MHSNCIEVKHKIKQLTWKCYQRDKSLNYFTAVWMRYYFISLDKGPNMRVPREGIVLWPSGAVECLCLCLSPQLQSQTEEDVREGWASSSGGNGLCRPPTLRLLCVKLAERM